MGEDTERIKRLEDRCTALEAALLCVGFCLQPAQRQRLAALLEKSLTDQGINLNATGKGVAVKLLRALQSGEEWLGLLPDDPR